MDRGAFGSPPAWTVRSKSARAIQIQELGSDFFMSVDSPPGITDLPHQIKSKSNFSCNALKKLDNVRRSGILRVQFLLGSREASPHLENLHRRESRHSHRHSTRGQKQKEDIALHLAGVTISALLNRAGLWS